MRNLSPRELSRTYYIPEDAAENAFRNLASKENFLIGISGKLGAGKDTFAEAVSAAARKQGLTTTPLSFGTALKEEASAVLKDFENGMSVDEVSIKHGVSPAEAERMLTIYAQILGKGLTAFDKVPETRAALQAWGTDIRRNQDGSYWVKKTAQKAAALLSNNTRTLVVVVDTRFKNEAAMTLDLGGDMIRLNVSREEQEKRIMGRDGIVPNIAALEHPSEKELDDYLPFDFILDTDKKSPSELAEDYASGSESFQQFLKTPVV